MAKPNKFEGKDASPASAMAIFHPAVRNWFEDVFPAPTAPQFAGWPAIARGESTLILAPTGTGKTLAAFLWCINRIMFSPVPDNAKRCRVLYISPIKTYTGLRRTRGRANREELLGAYGRRKEPCRRCGTLIESHKQNPDARTTFWCPQCQLMARQIASQLIQLPETPG